MRITKLTLMNWRNFKAIDVPLGDRLFVVGPNASGKSNLLDAFRFLRNLAVVGGGIQQAIQARGGLQRVRCLAARNFNHGQVGIVLELNDDDNDVIWDYELHFTAERRGRHRPIVAREIVRKNGEELLQRPDIDDKEDSERLIQTALEQVNANREFRPVAEFLEGVRYLHLVPQVIRDPELTTDRVDDPFGSDFLVRIAETPEATRRRRLKRVEEALRLAVPQLEQLELTHDPSGKPHLQARYRHWRVAGARQDERDFSDGTLRLIGLLWLLLEPSKRRNRVVLLEEPELSLHASIVQQLPTILSRATRSSGPQVVLSTHAAEVLADPGLGLDEVLVLQPADEGTTAVLAKDIPEIESLIEAGMNLDEVLMPMTRPEGAHQLSLLL